MPTNIRFAASPRHSWVMRRRGRDPDPGTVPAAAHGPGCIARVAQSGRAAARHAEGRRFESCHVHHTPPSRPGGEVKEPCAPIRDGARRPGLIYAVKHIWMCARLISGR